MPAPRAATHSHLQTRSILSQAACIFHAKSLGGGKSEAPRVASPCSAALLVSVRAVFCHKKKLKVTRPRNLQVLARRCKESGVEWRGDERGKKR